MQGPAQRYSFLDSQEYVGVLKGRIVPQFSLFFDQLFGLKPVMLPRQVY